MIRRHVILLTLLISTLLVTSCLSNDPADLPAAAKAAAPENFGDYWYQGKAELTHYTLEQARYGEIHKGDAALIFVTEDFLANRQVKYEYGNSDDPVVKILKLNASRRFFTGIYPYSTLSSVFSPVDGDKPHSIKISNTVQEWCGHVYSQLNHRGDKYQGISHSYFQQEADQNFMFNEVLLEDEIWTNIRLNPERLPSGEVDIFPGLLYLRLRHKPFQVEKAIVGFSVYEDTTLSNKPLRAYTVNYKRIKRKLKIIFEAPFPFKIVAWEEQIPDGTDWLTTRARKTHEMFTDYWSKNSVADSTNRKEFGY